jgi:hypothetical protein
LDFSNCIVQGLLDTTELFHNTHPDATRYMPSSLLSGIIEDVGQVATSAILTVVHGGHEDTGTALLSIRMYMWYEALR